MVNNFYKKYTEIIELLNECIDTKTNLSKFLREKGMSSSKVADFKKRTLNSFLTRGIITETEYNLFLELHNKCLNSIPIITNIEKVVISEQDDYSDRHKTTIERDDDNLIEVNGSLIGRIVRYNYEVLVRGKSPLRGSLSRDEMDMIYRLYSCEGANLTQRTVSRYFPEMSLQDFKRILLAFNISKNSTPFAPHILEENEVDDIIGLSLRIKDNEFFRKLEEQKIKHQQKRNEELTHENEKLKNKINDIELWVNSFNIDNIVPYVKPKMNHNSEKSIVLFLSDWHVGCEVNPDESLYFNEYNENVLNERLNKVYDQIFELSRIEKFDKVIICNLGDSLDGYDKKTTRGGHELPQNMNNKEQFNVYVRSVIKFIESIQESDICQEVEYQCVDGGNHCGDFGYVANRAIQMFLGVKYPEMTVNIFKKFIGRFDYGVHSYLITHGKDSVDMFKGLPFNLDEKTENFINQYIDYNNINNKTINFIKGDLHRTSVSYGRRFRYKNVSSILGSSKWIHANFGNTKAAVDYEIVYKNKETILEGRIVLN